MRKPIELDFKPRVHVGVDLGQANDPTAIAVIETFERAVPDIPRLHAGIRKDLEQELVVERHTYKTPYLLRSLERLPLQMPYPDQVIYVMNRVAGLPAIDPMTLIDFTGVGRAVWDMFVEQRMPNCHGVAITAGMETNRTSIGWNVPKTALIQPVQALLHSGRLRIAKDIPDQPVLVRELQNFRARYSNTGKPTFAAREGQHDDLVLAVSLAVYGASQPRPVSIAELNRVLKWAM